MQRKREKKQTKNNDNLVLAWLYEYSNSSSRFIQRSREAHFHSTFKEKSDFWSSSQAAAALAGLWSSSSGISIGIGGSMGSLFGACTAVTVKSRADCSYCRTAEADLRWSAISYGEERVLASVLLGAYSQRNSLKFGATAATGNGSSQWKLSSEGSALTLSSGNSTMDLQTFTH